MAHAANIRHAFEYLDRKTYPGVTLMKMTKAVRRWLDNVTAFTKSKSRKVIVVVRNGHRIEVVDRRRQWRNRVDA